MLAIHDGVLRPLPAGWTCEMLAAGGEFTLAGVQSPRLDRLVWGFARFLVAAIEVLDRLRTFFLSDKAADGD